MTYDLQKPETIAEPKRSPLQERRKSYIEGHRLNRDLRDDEHQPMRAPMIEAEANQYNEYND